MPIFALYSNSSPSASATKNATRSGSFFRKTEPWTRQFFMSQTTNDHCSRKMIPQHRMGELLEWGQLRLLLEQRQHQPVPPPPRRGGAASPRRGSGESRSPTAWKRLSRLAAKAPTTLPTTVSTTLSLSIATLPTRTTLSNYPLQLPSQLPYLTALNYSPPAPNGKAPRMEAPPPRTEAAAAAAAPAGSCSRGPTRCATAWKRPSRPPRSCRSRFRCQAAVRRGLQERRRVEGREGRSN